jgi:hypothetical protein
MRPIDIEVKIRANSTNSQAMKKTGIILTQGIEGGVDESGLSRFFSWLENW